MVVEFQLGWPWWETTAEERTDQVAQRPDGSWSFEDARRRREQREGWTTRARPAHLRRARGRPLRARAQPRRQPHRRRHAALPARGPPGARRQRRSRPARSQRSDRRGDHACARGRAARSSSQQQQRTARNDDPRPIHSPHQPTRTAGRHTARYAPRRWVIACIRRRRCHGRARGRARVRNGYHPARAPRAARSPPGQQPRPRTHAGGDEPIPRRGARRGSHAQPRRPTEFPRRGPGRSHPRQTPLRISTHAAGSPPASTAHHRQAAHPKRSIPRNRPAHQAPAGPRTPRRQDRVTIPSDPAAQLAQLELGLELLHPIQSSPQITGHRSRHLQLPVARTRPSPQEGRKTREHPGHEGKRRRTRCGTCRRRATLPLEPRGLPSVGRRRRQRRQLRARRIREQRHDRRVRRQRQRRHAPRQAPALRTPSEPNRAQLGARPPNRESLGGGRTNGRDRDGFGRCRSRTPGLERTTSPSPPRAVAMRTTTRRWSASATASRPGAQATTSFPGGVDGGRPAPGLRRSRSTQA